MKAINDKILQGKDLEIGKTYVLVSRHEFVSNDEFGEQFFLTEGMVDDIPQGELFYEVDMESQRFPAGGIESTTSDEYFIGASANNLIEEEEKWFHKEEEYKELSDFDKKIFKSLNENLTIQLSLGGRDCEYITGVLIRFNGLDIYNAGI